MKIKKSYLPDDRYENLRELLDQEPLNRYIIIVKINIFQNANKKLGLIEYIIG